jgi:16S rRNA (guanine966-N2)-methyltransferase
LKSSNIGGVTQRGIRDAQYGRLNPYRDAAIILPVRRRDRRISVRYPFLLPPNMPVPSANRIRIIGGTWRGRLIRFPPAERLRPTPDRVRETLFNWLGQELTGKRCLDLYTGTGALSLEAMSRGAMVAVAVDRSRAAIAALRATGEDLGAGGLETHIADVRPFMAREARTFDVIFADPPFDANPWPWLLPACAARLAAGGLVYAEAGHALEPPPPLVPWRRDKAGQVHYHLFALSRAPAG